MQPACWDETGEKGLLVAQLDQTVSAAPVWLNLPRFYDLEVFVSREALTALEQVLPPESSPNLYRVTLTGNGPVELEQLRKRFSHLAYLELRDETDAQTNPFDFAGEEVAGVLAGFCAQSSVLPPSSRVRAIRFFMICSKNLLVIIVSFVDKNTANV